jgi:hypothetical protein
LICLRYDPTALDDEDYDELSMGDRREAERMMEERDINEGRRRGDRDILYGNQLNIYYNRA